MNSFLSLRIPCNLADDTSLSAFGTNIKDVLFDLEYDTQAVIVWFNDNFMKMNEDKCHFLISGNLIEHLWIKVGDELIWASAKEKLLGVTIDKDLKFNSHLAILGWSESDCLGKNCQTTTI